MIDIDFSCTIDGCDSVAVNGKLCNRHKSYLDRHGTLERECVSCGTTFTYATRKTNSKSRCESCNELFKEIGRSHTAHGITAAQYLEIYTAQQGRCKLCNHKPDKLTIDHDHRCCHNMKPNGEARNTSCGKCIRGLLCNGCNAMLGYYENVKGDLIVQEFEIYLATPHFRSSL